MNGYQQVAAKARELGISSEQLLQRMQATTPATPASNPAQPQQAAPAAFDESALTESVMERVRLENAYSSHTTAREMEPTLVQSGIKTLLGDSPNAELRELIENAAIGIMEKNRKTYPKGHPLETQRFAPYDASRFEQEVMPKLRAFQKAVGAQAMQTIAGAGRTTQTIAGVPSGQGVAVPTTKVPLHKMTPDQQRAANLAFLAAKYPQGQPMAR
jgi:hypothetical protein